MLKNNQILIILILAIFALRLFISFMPSFEYDQNAFRIWSYRLAEGGLTNFYSPDTFTNNPIGFLYLLWIIALVKINLLVQNAFFIPNNHYDLLLKIPANAADLIAATLIYFFLKREINQKAAWAGFLFYALNPAIFFNSAIWGQYDGVAALFLLLSAFTLIQKKSPEVASVFLAVALSFKPQTIAFTPIFGLALLLNYNFKRWLYSFVVFFITALIIYLPFFPTNPLKGIIDVNVGSTSLFNCTTCFALNFWGVFGNWRADSLTFLGITYLHWGMIMLVITYLTIFWTKQLGKILASHFFYLTASISIISFFILLTRMHERYLFPIFPFLLISSFLLKSRFLLGIYFLISAIYFINLYIPYVYYNNQLGIKTFPLEISEQFSFFSYIAVFVFAIFYLYYQKIIRSKVKIDENTD